MTDFVDEILRQAQLDGTVSLVFLGRVDGTPWAVHTYSGKVPVIKPAYTLPQSFWDEDYSVFGVITGQFYSGPRLYFGSDGMLLFTAEVLAQVRQRLSEGDRPSKLLMDHTVLERLRRLLGNTVLGSPSAEIEFIRVPWHVVADDPGDPSSSVDLKIQVCSDAELWVPRAMPDVAIVDPVGVPRSR